jgi:hypothetical protein
VKFEALELELKHYNYDWFQIASSDPDSWNGLLAQFHVDEDGKVTKLLLLLEPTVKPLIFKRQ